MKFQKTAIALTIAGFAAAPMMASADTVLSGVVQVKYQGTDADDDDPDMAAGDVRVAISTEHELNSGLIGYGNVQLNVDDLTGEGGFVGRGLGDGVDADLLAGEQDDIADPDGSLTDEDIVELTSAATVAADNVYVGVKGGFGDIRFGEIPLAIEYGQLANDIHDVGTTVVDGVSYTGTFGIFGIGLNHSLAEEDSDVIGVGAKFNFAGATIGLGFEDRDEAARYAIGASYAIAGFTIAAHYWAGEDEFDPELNIDTGADDQVQTSGFDINDTTNFAVQVGYNIAGVSIGLTYSILEDDNGVGAVEASAAGITPVVAAVPATVQTDEINVIRLDLGYDLGGGMEVSTRIQSTSTDSQFEDDRDAPDVDDLVEYRVMLSKTF